MVLRDATAGLVFSDPAAAIAAILSYPEPAVQLVSGRIGPQATVEGRGFGAP